MEASVRFRATAALSSEKGTIYPSNERLSVSQKRSWRCEGKRVLFLPKTQLTPSVQSSIPYLQLKCEETTRVEQQPYMWGDPWASVSCLIHASAHWSKSKVHSRNVGSLKSAQASRRIMLISSSCETARLAYGGNNVLAYSRLTVCKWQREGTRDPLASHIQREK